MVNYALMENAKLLLLLFLLVLLTGCMTDTSKENNGRGRIESKSKPSNNESSAKSYFNEKVITQKPLKELNHANIKTKSDSFNQEFRSEINKSVKEKLTSKEYDREDEFLRKASRDALIGKSGSKSLNKEENFNSFNMKLLNSQEKQSEDKFSSTLSFTSQKHLNIEDSEDYLSTSRQRKPKKQGISGSIPFPTPRERKPNIILILTDDQDVELGSLNFMPKTLRLLRDGGAEFRHAYVTTPMCCPSRSSLLTGMYVHNHQVFTNNENCSNIMWQQTHETRTFATYLSNAGYRTGYFGKYLNKYNGSYIPPGWREWGGLIMNSRYYNYSINLNGKKIKHGFDYSKDYYPDLIANDSITFLRQSKQYFSRKPVMLVVSFPAPHGPEDSAPQYSKMFFNVTTHHTPSYDFAPNPDKQWILQVTNKMQSIHKQFTDVLMTKRLQTLQSVDTAVERIYQELKYIGELDNTYIIYTSDHGYHLGQFGLVKGKSFPFEFDVRVPFLVRGPGVEPGTVVDDIVLNIDLAPTFLDIAGVESPLHMDGRSIVRLLHYRPNKRRRMKWPDTFLIESSGRREIPETIEARRIRLEKNEAKARLLKEKEIKANKSRTSEVETSGLIKVDTITVNEANEKKNASSENSEADFIDETDENSEDEDMPPSFELNRRYQQSSIKTHSETQVDNKIPQIGLTMTQQIPKTARIALECQTPELQSPCKPGQKWHCVAEGDRWRKHKCKIQRKCTCFTPNGFVYTGIFNDDRSGISGLNFRKAKFVRRKRSKLYLNIWSEIPRNHPHLMPLLERSRKIMKRAKRGTTDDHIDDVLDDLEHELHEAEEIESSMNVTDGVKQETNVSKCFVTSNGKVNCSSVVYNDIKIWRQNRDSIDAKIKQLKSELETLKEIRKHLREKRPGTTASPPNVIVQSTSEVDKEILHEISTESIIITTEAITTYAITSESENKTFVESGTKKYYTVTDASNSYSPTTLRKNSFKNNTAFGKTVPFNNSISPVTVPPGSSIKSDSHEDEDSVNRIGTITVNRGRDRCICRPDSSQLAAKREEKEIAKEAKRKLKEERLRKKERKLKKKAKLEKECLSERMNCFMHDNEHWKTPPLWTEGPFCFCMNANNNTYSCLRTINSTHNFLYCEFTTGFKTFYNLRIDPFEQLNRISTLTPDESRYLNNQLSDIKSCKGTKDCTLGSGKVEVPTSSHHQHHSHYLTSTKEKRPSGGFNT